MQWDTPDIGGAFGSVEQALRGAFILALFWGLGEGKLGQGVPCLPVKQAGLALPDPTMKTPENWVFSCIIKRHLVTALRGQE